MVRMKSKKASNFLEAETLKIVLAVICLGLLIFLGVKLYSLFTKQTAIEQARETLQQIVNRADSLEEGMQNKFMITSPQDWYLMLFNPGEPMPEDCDREKSCICICGDKSYDGCNKNGVCKIIALEGKMSYTCLDANMVGVGLLNKCLKIKIQEILLKKENNILFIGESQTYNVGEKLSRVLQIIDSVSGKSVEDLIFDLISDNKESKRFEIKKLVRAYIAENVSEIDEKSNWAIELRLNGQIVANIVDTRTMGYYDTYSTAPRITYSQTFEKEIERNGNKYMIIIKFNTKTN